MHLLYLCVSVIWFYCQCTALESGRIALDVKKQFQVEEGVLSTAWPVQCGVWAYADQLKRKAGFAKSDVEILKQHSMHVRTCACMHLLFECTFVQYVCMFCTDIIMCVLCLARSL